MSDRIDEYYVIRVSRKVSDARKTHSPEREVFVSNSGSLGAVSKAKAFYSIEEAEAYLAQRKDTDHYTFQIQYCTLFKPPQEDDHVKTITDQLMQIPYPYRRTAYNWYRGRDVEVLLKRESDEVYQRHRKLLLDYGINIKNKSDVILLGRKRKRKIPFQQTKTTTNAPRQYFAYPAQRPKPVADQTHPTQRYQRKHKEIDNS
jgi:hypothetical protein